MPKKRITVKYGGASKKQMRKSSAAQRSTIRYPAGYKRKVRRDRVMNCAIPKLKAVDIGKTTEVKWFDLGGEDDAMNGGQFYVPCLNAIPQGNSANTRIGDKVYLRKLCLKLRVYDGGWANAALALDPTVSVPPFRVAPVMRVLVVLDRFRNYTAVDPDIIGDVLSAPPAGNLYRYSQCFVNPDNAKRFKILHDKVHHWRNEGHTTAQAPYTFAVQAGQACNAGTGIVDQIDIPLDIVSDQRALGGTVDTIGTGNLFFAVLWDDQAGGGGVGAGQMKLGFTSRVYFEG